MFLSYAMLLSNLPELLKNNLERFADPNRSHLVSFSRERANEKNKNKGLKAIVAGILGIIILILITFNTIDFTAKTIVLGLSLYLFIFSLLNPKRI